MHTSRVLYTVWWETSRSVRVIAVCIFEQWQGKDTRDKKFKAELSLYPSVSKYHKSRLLSKHTKSFSSTTTKSCDRGWFLQSMDKNLPSSSSGLVSVAKIIEYCYHIDCKDHPYNDNGKVRQKQKWLQKCPEYSSPGKKEKKIPSSERRLPSCPTIASP